MDLTSRQNRDTRRHAPLALAVEAKAVQPSDIELKPTVL
jgi:hypothetical protein